MFVQPREVSCVESHSLFSLRSFEHDQIDCGLTMHIATDINLNEHLNNQKQLLHQLN